MEICGNLDKKSTKIFKCIYINSNIEMEKLLGLQHSYLQHSFSPKGGPCFRHGADGFPSCTQKGVLFLFLHPLGHLKLRLPSIALHKLPYCGSAGISNSKRSWHINRQGALFDGLIWQNGSRPFCVLKHPLGQRKFLFCGLLRQTSPCILCCG